MINFSYFLKHRVGRKRRNTAELAAQLAPLEEQTKRGMEIKSERAPISGSIQESGAILVKSDLDQLPSEIAVPKDHGILGIEPVVLVIVVLMLAFIGFIAWQISQMPVPD